MYVYNYLDVLSFTGLRYAFSLDWTVVWVRVNLFKITIQYIYRFRTQLQWYTEGIDNMKPPSCQYLFQMPVSRSRRNPRSICVWLTGPEPRLGYARSSFVVNAAAEVAILKCTLWKSWTLELTSEFFHVHLTILTQCGMLAGYIKTIQAEERQSYIYIYCRVKPKSGEKKAAFQRITYRPYIWKVLRKSTVR